MKAGGCEGPIRLELLLLPLSSLLFYLSLEVFQVEDGL